MAKWKPEAPASFEDLRKYLSEAVDQLAREMAQQQANYLVPADNVLALLEAVALVRGESAWNVWEAWALRHAIPIHDMLSREETMDRAVMAKRLRDLLGYCLLGLMLCEKEAP